MKVMPKALLSLNQGLNHRLKQMMIFGGCIVRFKRVCCGNYMAHWPSSAEAKKCHYIQIRDLEGQVVNVV